MPSRRSDPPEKPTRRPVLTGTATFKDLGFATKEREHNIDLDALADGTGLGRQGRADGAPPQCAGRASFGPRVPAPAPADDGLRERHTKIPD